MNYKKINRCLPGYGSSCAFCCGSHNYSEKPEIIQEIFYNRSRENLVESIRHPEETLYKKLFHDAMQCSHVGMQASNPGIMHCMIYNNPERGDELEGFFKGTCKNFYCNAWYDLTEEQVIFAARLMSDWYYYSLFINDIESVHDMHAQYSEPEDVPQDVLYALKKELMEKMFDEDGK